MATFTVRIAFASPKGPTLDELRAIRTASDQSERWPASEWLAGLRGVVEIALPDVTTEDVERLRSRGLSVERVARPHTAAELFALLGLDPVVEGEIRWFFAPSFEPLLVLSARLVNGIWELDLRRPRGSLLEPASEPPSQPRDLQWRPLQVDVWRRTTPDDAAVSAALAAWGEASASSSELGCDGTSISASTMIGGVVTDEETWSPRRAVDPRGHAMASAGLALARRFDEPEAARAVARIGWSPDGYYG